jgi:hypothetical protein
MLHNNLNIVGLDHIPVCLDVPGDGGWIDLAERLRLAKRAFTTRRVDFGEASRLVTDRAPKPGDLVLAAVTGIGQHMRLETPEGRRQTLYEGDEILVAYGARYAPDQFDAVVPEGLGPCDLAAGGGVAAKVVRRHARMARPTALCPAGLLAASDGHILNLADFALPSAIPTSRFPVVIAVVGTSMNAGKTTTAAALVKGLSRAGLKVGAAKLTGTGSGGDIWSLIDAGATPVLDFTDLGHASTAALPLAEVERVALQLIAHLSALDLDLIVVEIADGVLQRETAHLLTHGPFLTRLGGVVFAAADALGAAGGVARLQQSGVSVLAISGLVSASPLAREETELATGIRVVGIDTLSDPLFAPMLGLSAPQVISSQAASR